MCRHLTMSRITACVGRALAGRHSRRSCGLDGIPDIDLKRAVEVLFGFIQIRFNRCLNSCDSISNNN